MRIMSKRGQHWERAPTVARVLGASPSTIHGKAAERPELLGFPMIMVGRRVKIPKRAFIKFFQGGQDDGR